MSYHQYIGIPYRHLGRDKNGLDCYGLLLLYYREQLGVEMKDWWYEPDWSLKGGNYFLDNSNNIAVKVDDPKLNDIILIYTDINRHVTNHAAIYVEKPNKCIQASKHGVVLTPFDSPVFRKRIEGFYRLKCHV